jgi:hypothetical protein
LGMRARGGSSSSDTRRLIHPNTLFIHPAAPVPKNNSTHTGPVLKHHGGCVEPQVGGGGAWRQEAKAKVFWLVL